MTIAAYEPPTAAPHATAIAPSIGFNIGHGWTKIVVLAADTAPATLVFPSLVTPAVRQTMHDLVQLPTVKLGGTHHWVGEDAQRTGVPPEFTQTRIQDEWYIPILVKGAMQRLSERGLPMAELLATAKCVSGLPAAWSRNPALCRTLAERIRQGLSPVSVGSVRVMAEPVGAVYSAMLNDQGGVEDDRYRTTKVAVVDLGTGTVDTAVVDALVTDPASLMTYQLGTVEPITQLQQTLSAQVQVDLPWHAVEAAVRTGRIVWGAIDEPLPDGWEAPFAATGLAVAAKLEQSWKRGLQFTSIMLGGGGAEIPALVAPILTRFRNATLLPDPQLAIARGYARYGRFLSRQSGQPS